MEKEIYHSGRVLSKEEVLTAIISNAHAANSNPTSGYETLTYLFEASFGVDSHIELVYDRAKDKFIIQ